MSQSALFEYFKKGEEALEVLLCEDAKEANELLSVAKYFQKEALVFPD